MAAALRHQHLYKAKTPPWKEVYRRRCQDRMKSSRQAIVQRFRNLPEDCGREEEMLSMVNEIMREEWDILQQNSTSPAIFPNDRASSSRCQVSDGDLKLIEQTQKELLELEQEILTEYEYLTMREEMTDNAVAAWWINNDVLCPLCQKSFLTKEFNLIACQCGLRLRTEREMQLPELKEAVDSAVNGHSTGCPNKLDFSVLSTSEHTETLACVCSACDLMHVIL